MFHQSYEAAAKAQKSLVNGSTAPRDPCRLEYETLRQTLQETQIIVKDLQSAHICAKHMVKSGKDEMHR